MGRSAAREGFRIRRRPSVVRRIVTRRCRQSEVLAFVEAGGNGVDDDAGTSWGRTPRPEAESSLCEPARALQRGLLTALRGTPRRPEIVARDMTSRVTARTLNISGAIGVCGPRSGPFNSVSPDCGIRARLAHAPLNLRRLSHRSAVRVSLQTFSVRRPDHQ